MILSIWTIEAPLSGPSSCLKTFLPKYSQVYDRASEAACRVAVNFVLRDCIAELARNGINHQPTENKALSGQPSTQQPFGNVKVYCQVSFTHTIGTPNISQDLVSGLVDHAVAITLPSRDFKKPNRIFYCLLFCIVKLSVDSALPELVVYLASLRQSRIHPGKRDSSVYGVATNGFDYLFVTISHEGFLRTSKYFDITHGDLPTVLGYLRYILETAISISPNASLKQGVVETGGDEVIHPDESSYLDTELGDYD